MSGPRLIRLRVRLRRQAAFRSESEGDQRDGIQLPVFVQVLIVLEPPQSVHRVGSPAAVLLALEVSLCGECSLNLAVPFRSRRHLGGAVRWVAGGLSMRGTLSGFMCVCAGLR